MNSAEDTLVAGRPLDQAHGAMIFLHGRGSSPEDILGLARHLDADDLAWLAPRATNGIWYPLSFLAPEAENQPDLDAALGVVRDTLARIRDHEIPQERIYLIGFSQGACLALESTARHPGRYGGIFALSGGLIGLGVNRREFTGDFENTPIVMGCSDSDPHIPKDRFEESAAVLAGLQADVDAVLYPNFGHTVNQHELNRINRVLRASPAPGASTPPAP